MHIVQECIITARKAGFCYAEDGKTRISALDFEDRIKGLVKENGADLKLDIKEKDDTFVFLGVKKK